MLGNMWKTLIVLVSIIVAIYGKSNPSKKKVCVIGAGAAGLATIKQLSNFPDEFEAILFERQSDVGGLWIYTDSTTVDQNGLPVHSSVYKNLRTNFPKELEVFPDYPHFEGNESKSSFIKHPQMLEYLRNYTRHYNLRQYIQCNSYVEKVIPLPEMRWLIVIRDFNTESINEIECDAVFVANGNNFKGHIPILPGIESFPGRVIHSHLYRKPDDYANQTVVILGASFSGLDISIEISYLAKKVYLSHRHEKLQIEMPANIEQIVGVVGAEGNKLILSDGSKVTADALILCTGYDFYYPFLDASSGIVVESGKYVRSVYKNLINIERPTMAILNLPIPGFPFVTPHAQAAYFIAVLRGKIQLPSREDMLKEAALPPGVPKSKAHYMLDESPSYYNGLALAAGYDPLPDLYWNASFTLIPYIVGDPWHFREKKLHFYENGTIEFF